MEDSSATPAASLNETAHVGLNETLRDASLNETAWRP